MNITSMIAVQPDTIAALNEITGGDFDEAFGFVVTPDYKQRLWETTGQPFAYNPAIISAKDYLALAMYCFPNEPLKTTFPLHEVYGIHNR